MRRPPAFRRIAGIGRTLLLIAALMPGLSATRAHASGSRSGNLLSEPENWWVWTPRTFRSAGVEMEPGPPGPSGNPTLVGRSKSMACYALMMREPLPVEPGEKVRIRVRVRAGEETNYLKNTPGIMLRLQFESPEADPTVCLVSLNGDIVPGEEPSPRGLLKWSGLPKRYGQDFDPGALPRDWREIAVTVQVPPGAATLAVHLFGNRTEGPVSWDGLEVSSAGPDDPVTSFLRKERKFAGEWPIPEDRLYERMNLNFPGLEAVRDAVESGDMAAAKAAYLRFRRETSTAKYYKDAFDRNVKPEATTDPTGEEVRRHFVRNRMFSNLPTEADMGPDFDWTHNPVARDDPDFTDQWTFCVISRMSFWPDLTQAYRRTLNEDYAAEWIWQFRDFYREHPLTEQTLDSLRDLLWLGLDAAIRMNASWPEAYFTFLNSPSFSADDNWHYAWIIHEHGIYLSHYLNSFPGLSGNWATIIARGLYMIGALNPEFKDAEAWREIAVNKLVDELDHGVTGDGISAELSTGYHYTFANSFLGVVEMADRNGLELPSDFTSRLVRLYRAPLLIMDQSGFVSPVNDSRPLDAVERAAKAMEISDDPVIKWAVSGKRLGEPLPESTALPYSGFYAMRSGWEPDDLFLFFRSGPSGSGHVEQSQLHIVLKAFGETLLFNPEVYSYDTSKWRRFYSNTPSHNTIIVDGKWQNLAKPELPIDEPTGNPWVTTDSVDFVAGTYDAGYQENIYDGGIPYQPWRWAGEPDRSVAHTRRIVFLKPYYALVADSVDGTGTRQVDAHFHLDAPGAGPGAEIDPATGAVYSLREDEVQLVLLPLQREHLETEIIKGQQEPLLGWKPYGQIPIPTVRFRKTQQVPADFLTFLYPFKGERPTLESEALPLENFNGWALRLESAHETAELILSRAFAPQSAELDSAILGPVELSAAGYVARQPADAAKPTNWTAWEMEHYRDARVAFELSPAATLTATLDGDGYSLRNEGETTVVLRLTEPENATLELAPGEQARLP